MSVDNEGRHAAEYDKNPRRKASVPKESVDHECDSSVETIGTKYTRTGTDLNMGGAGHRAGRRGLLA
jgi:hypothetical protein